MYKLELKSSHEVIDTVDVVNIESIFCGKPTDPDILTVVMKDGKRLYCDEVCPVDSLQKEPVSEELEDAAKNYSDNENPICTCEECLIKSFKVGAKWQEEKDNEEKVLTYKHGFDDCKEQMMAKAIDAEICEVPDNDYSIYEHTHLELFVEPNTLEKKGFKDNDKVKVIVIKKG